MDMTTIPIKKGDFNLKDYEAICKEFSWREMENAFTWKETGKVNIAYEAIDRYAEDWNTRKKPALIYSSPEREEQYTFEQMSKASNKVANILKKYGMEKGSRVFLFMPRIPEFYIALFGILKIGAIAGPLFEGFTKQMVGECLQDSEASLLITTKDLLKKVPIDRLSKLKHVMLVGVEEENYISYEKEMESASDRLEVEWVDLEDGMLLHYTTSTHTGKLIGVYHVHYAMVQHYATARWVLDLKEDDVYWCTADPAWGTGSSYGIFAPWLYGITNVIRSGRFTSEDWYELLEKYKVNVWYTTPTALRMLIGNDEGNIKDYNLSSLRHILSVGEALSPEVITWGLQTFGLRIHDTWSMTETGAQLIANLPTLEIRPGSMGKAIPGIKATIVNHEGKELPPNQMGNLAIKAGWPSMMRRIWNDQDLYDRYFINGWYVSGDRAYRDEDGYFWFQGRLNDVIYTEDEQIASYKVERTLIEHEAVAEAGVIGKPHPERGEIIKAFITLNDGYEESKELIENIRHFVKMNMHVGQVPHEIEVCDTIPKTRSGKIMRHLLKSWS